MKEEDITVVDVLKLIESALRSKNYFSSEDKFHLKQRAVELYQKRETIGLDSKHFEPMLDLIG
ncbi:MAG: hypothetical protein ACXAD7_03055 [Candidatus Kariarchaeaceae archaeon]|jgi:hypothetical protein